jgi:CheY-like chemotaxis protein
VVDHQDGGQRLAGRFVFDALCLVHDPGAGFRGAATGAADSPGDSGQGKHKGRIERTQPKAMTDVSGAMKSLQDASSESTGKLPPTVLVVVDEVLVRMALSDYLRECGYNVVETSDAQEAIEVMTSDVAVDVAFSDIVMPGSLDGFGLAQWIRRERPDIKVVLSSGVARSAKAAGELCEHGPMLAKPYEHADLERRIRALLASAPKRD